MYWATTTFKVHGTHPTLTKALRAWQQHIAKAHPKIREVRCYATDGGTTYVWQEGFENFHDYQKLIEEEDAVCAKVMGAVFRHMIPGTRHSKMWSDGL